MKHIEQWLALYPEATDIHLTEGGRIIVREYGGLKELEERAEKSFSLVRRRCIFSGLPL